MWLSYMKLLVFNLKKQNKTGTLLFVFYFVSVFLFFFWDRISCSPGLPGASYVDQAGLELRETSLPFCFLDTKIKDMYHQILLRVS